MIYHCIFCSWFPIFWDRTRSFGVKMLLVLVDKLINDYAMSKIVSSPQFGCNGLNARVNVSTSTNWTENAYILYIWWHLKLSWCWLPSIVCPIQIFSQHYLQYTISVSFVIDMIKNRTLTFPMLHTSNLLPPWALPRHLPNLHHTHVWIKWTSIQCI